MEYRTNRKTGDKISIIGIGASYLHEASPKERDRLLTKAYENGINYMDLAAGDGKAFEYYGAAFSSVRENIIYQIHFGADYSKGPYARKYKLDDVKRALDWQLKTLKTDYINYGYIHCIDEESQWNQYVKDGIYDYLLEMKRQGVIKHIGLGSHTPSTARKILEEVEPDMLMFSINPAFDYKKGSYGIGRTDERMDLYRRCEAMGTGIAVMKCFGGGQLLDAKHSPFGKALTEYQCMRYALSKPGVLTLLPGVSSEAHIDKLLGYLSASDEEKDFSVLGSFAPAEAMGKCIYCNHCRPCPAGIDIATVSKYYDLAKAGDEMTRDHYMNLSVTASRCIGCGHCDSACPFKVNRSDRMKEIREYFGK